MNIKAEIYTSGKYFEKEKELFDCNWLLVCHESAISKPGDYKVFSRLNKSIIIIRQQDGSIAAFRNSCIHRGSYLLKGKGRCSTIRCPYHGWEYHTSGKLLNPVHMQQTGKQLEDVELKQYLGFVWIRLSQGKKFLFPDRNESLITETMEKFQPKLLNLTKSRTFYLKCNWKNYLENIIDSYHINTVHNRLLQKISKVENLEIFPETGGIILQLPVADYTWRVAFERLISGRFQSRENSTANYYKIYISLHSAQQFTQSGPIL